MFAIRDSVGVIRSFGFFFQGSKPWRYTGEEENMDRKDIKVLVKKWRDIYDDESLDFKRTGSLPLPPIEQTGKKFTAAGGVVHFISAPSAA